MTEHTLAFGLNKALIGTICLPLTAQSSGIGVIFFNAGVVHRIGPHRIHVRLARALAAKGISSIRFDLSGQGDSARPVVPNAFEIQVEMDVQAAMQALGDATGLTQFALFGFCSGAYQGFPIALADARLTGLLMYDAFLYPTIRSRLNRYRMRIRQHGLVNAAARFAWREIAALAARLMPGAHGAGKGQPAVDEGFFAELPTKPVFAAGLGKLVSRGVKVGLIFSGGTFERYNYAGQFSDAFAGLDIVDKLTLHYFPDMDHLVSAIAAQVELIEYIERWMVDLNMASRAVSVAAK